MQSFERLGDRPALAAGGCCAPSPADRRRSASRYDGEFLSGRARAAPASRDLRAGRAAMAVYDALEACAGAALVRSWYANERIAFIGATGGHFASTCPRSGCAGSIRHGGQPARCFFLQPAAALVEQLEPLSPPRSFRPTRPWRCCSRRRRTPAGCASRRARSGPGARRYGGHAEAHSAPVRLHRDQQLRRVRVPRAGVAMPLRQAAPEQRLGDPRAGGRALGPCQPASPATRRC